MTPEATVAVERDLELVRQRCLELARECGVDANYVVTGRAADGSISATVEHSTSDLSFESLSRLSDVLKSRDVQVGCDCGTSSDRSHDPYLTVMWPSLEEASALLGVSP